MTFGPMDDFPMIPPGLEAPGLAPPPPPAPTQLTPPTLGPMGGAAASAAAGAKPPIDPRFLALILGALGGQGAPAPQMASMIPPLRGGRR